ncbi:MAG: hypothetical protein KatS3mg102_0159 [Planctomycetota bacterium]|nr:MAG: hypothetical protein KatS3mg102_0159 [Planctomycetota bacterium]
MREGVVTRALTTLALVAVLLAAPAARADKVYLISGEVYEGKVVHADHEKVQLERQFGSITSVMTFSRDEVVKIERSLTPEERIDKALAEASTPEACMEAARLAESSNMPQSVVRRCWERAIEIDPDFRPARERLGYRYLESERRWVTEREWKLAQGYQWYRGELLPPDEIQRRKQRYREQIEGSYREETKGVGWGERHIISTEHYEIHCNSTRKVAEGYAQFMEQLYKAYDKVFHGLPRYYQGKSKIYIFRNLEDFQTYGGGGGALGYYRPKSDNPNAYPDRIVVAFHGTFGTTGTTREVLAHEATHQFQHILCDGTPEQFLSRPPWWIEGLAVYFGDGYTLNAQGELEITIPRDRCFMIQRMIKSGQLPPISKFLRFSLGQYQMMAGMTYPYGWSLVYYFLHRGADSQGNQQPVEIHGKKVHLKQVFERFFKVVTEKPPAGVPLPGYGEYYARKLEELLGFEVDALTEDWKQFILGLKLEPLGEVRGERFVSAKLAFEITRPEGWEFRPDEVSGQEAIRIVNPATTGRITVAVQGNLELSTAEAALDALEGQAGMRIRSPMIDERNVIEVAGFPAAEVYYEGYEAPPENATREVEVRQNAQIYRHVMVVTLRRLYEIIMQCDADRWEDNKAAFQQALERFVPKGELE